MHPTTKLKKYKKTRKRITAVKRREQIRKGGFC